MVGLTGGCLAGAPEERVVPEPSDVEERPSFGPAPLLGNPVVPTRSEPPSQDASGCPSGTTPVVETEATDVVFVTLSDRCVVALGKNDLITSTASGFTAMLLGPGGDFGQGGFGANLLAGGSGIALVPHAPTSAKTGISMMCSLSRSIPEGAFTP